MSLDKCFTNLHPNQRCEDLLLRLMRNFSWIERWSYSFVIGISSTSGTVIHMFSYRRAEEYSFFCFAVLYNLLSQVPVCCFHKKKRQIQRKKEKGTQNIKKKLMLFFIAFHILLPLDFSLLSSVLLFELNHKFLPR